MASTTKLERGIGLLERLANDDDFREHANRSYRAGRGAVKKARGRKATVRPSVIKRTGVSLQEAGQVLIALGRAQPEPPKRRGRKLLTLTILGGLGAGAAYFARSRGGDTASTPATT